MEKLIIIITIFLLIFYLKKKNEIYKKDNEKNLEYYSYNSKINNWNPYLKVYYSMILLILCISTSNIFLSISVILIGGFITIFLGKIPLKKYMKFLKIPMFFLIINIIAINLNFSREIAEGYYLRINDIFIYTTDKNIEKSIVLFFRSFGGISAMYLLALSIPINEIILVMKKSKCPKVIVELMYLIYRFIFILTDTQREMRKSIESRLGFINYRTSLFSFGKIISNLLLISLKKAEMFYESMESRGYRGEIKFLERDKEINKKVFIGMVLSIIYLIGICLVAR